MPYANVLCKFCQNRLRVLDFTGGHVHIATIEHSDIQIFYMCTYLFFGITELQRGYFHQKHHIFIRSLYLIYYAL